MGSLPHDSIEAAVELAFAVDIPYLPELFARGEQMIAQALIEDPRRSHAAFDPFIDRLRAEGRSWAKVQIAGPLVVSAALKRRGDSARKIARALDAHAKKVAHLVEAVHEAGARALLFFDEPTLSDAERLDPLGEALEHAKHLGASLGVHCCGPVPWAAALALPAEVLAFDLSVGSPSPELLGPHLERGGWLGLGVIGTSPEHFGEVLAIPSELAPHLGQSLLMPACGLGTRSVEEAEAVFRTLERSAASMRGGPP